MAADENKNIRWIDAKTLPIEGKGWEDTEGYFDRLPIKAKKTIPHLFPWYSNCSAGLAIRFSTNSTFLKVKWTLIDMPNVHIHQAETGSSGLDLYVKTSENKWTYMAVAIPGKDLINDYVLYENQAKFNKTYLLNFPLYNGVTSLEIGIEEGSEFSIVKPLVEKKIVVYGTSIVQGCSACRPGMAYTAIIGRRLDCEIINLGFSGSALMEPEISDLLADLNPDMYIIDALPNMTFDPVTQRTLYMVRTIRKSRPNTPIILVECVYRTHGKAIGTRREDFINSEFRAVYEQLAKEKVANLHYVSGENLLGDDGEGTVDGTHPTDLGFMRMADIIGKAAKDVLDTI